MDLNTLITADAKVIHEALLQWKSEGVERPHIPMYVDLDGDGVTDAFSLDEKDELVIVPGVALEDTVYVSDKTEGN